ncbi:hypothetical protein FRC06_009193 [Ceratobasidium sp. 370]|nr:hypothetical protein FRC06_009193 [Ceratobasidium sp. 370]
MVSHTSFSIDGAGAGGGGGGMPGTPVKKAVSGASGAGIGGGPIAMGGARGWMTSLPDRGGKAFGGRNAPRPSLPIRFPGLSPNSPDDSPAAGRSKLPTIDSNESLTMHQFWNPGRPDESPSLRPRRKSGETSSLARRKSAGFLSDGEASVNGTPTRRGGPAVGGGMRGGLGGPAPALYNDRARPRPPSPSALALDPGAAPHSTPTHPDRSGARTRALGPYLNPSRARRRAVTRARGSHACREVPRPPRFLVRSRSHAPTFNPALAHSLPPASLPTHNRVPNLSPDAGAARALPTPYWRGWRPRSIAGISVRSYYRQRSAT